MTPLNGVIPVDKPAGPTSHDIVGVARRALGTRRVGHTGTLDPFATGLLLICVGPGTRLAEYLTGLTKVYVARMRLGATTATDDLEGELISSSEGWRDLTDNDVRSVLLALRGEQLQIPPLFSAKKVAGERSYAVARRGGEVDLPPVPIIIHRIEVIELDLPEVVFEVECSSGTYIRAIARDAGRALGVGGHLTALRRTGVGRFSVDDALSLEQLGDREAVERALIPPIDSVSHLHRFVIGGRERDSLVHGRAVASPDDAPEGQATAAVEGETLVAIGEVRGGWFHPRKVFA